MGRKARKLLKRPEIAEALGVHPQTIVKWERDGFPIAKRGGRGVAHLYDLDEGRAWKEAREEAQRDEPIDLARARARKELALAILNEQRAASAAEKLVEAEDVEREWTRHIAAVRTKLLSWPGTLVTRFMLAAQRGAEHLEAEMIASVREVLEELAAGDDPIDAEEQASVCGVKTSKGKPCSNPAGEDGRCWIPSHKKA